MLEGTTAETRAAVARAVEHFNAARYHEALDEFEMPYHHFSGEGRQLYLGLVRVSAALYHFSGGRFRSARRLYQSGAELLERFAPRREGIDIETLLAALRLTFQPLLDADDTVAATLRPESPPQIELSEAG